jgi:hypothetical protein
VIVTDRALVGAFLRLGKARAVLGSNSGVVTLQDIDSGYPAGVDLAERVRLFLRDAHANWGTQWVLLGGDETVVPMREMRLRMFDGIDVPADQYYACLDGNWNADGDEFWGESPALGEPGDAVDFLPELFVGRAPVRTVKETVAFVSRTLDYEARLRSGEPRSALLAAEVFGFAFDSAPSTEELRPALEADPSRSIERMYENSAAWPGSTQESRAALLQALDNGVDLAVLVGAGASGVFLAGEDPTDRVTSEDLLALTNSPLHPIVYAMSGSTTDTGDPLSIGNALLRAPEGGAVAVLGTSDVQFVNDGIVFMHEFFERALGPAAMPIGAALAATLAASHVQPPSDGRRLSTQAMLLLGDPTLFIDPPGSETSADTARRRIAPKTRPPSRELTAATPPITGADARPAAGSPVATSERRDADARTSRPWLEPPVPSLARTQTTVRFELPNGGNAGAYQVDVVDASGRRIRRLAGGAAAPARFERRWDLRSDTGAPVPRGVYFVRLRLAGTSQSRRVVVLR